MNIGTFLYTIINGKFVGTDDKGNKYYQHKKNNRRWVIYKSQKEPTTIPPKWHGWIHHLTNEIPENSYKWQKPSKANGTGSKSAYYPKGHILNGGNRSKVSSDYQPWQPN